MTENKDPLQGLLLDADEVDRARLAAALQDILGIDTKTGRVVPKPGYTRLTTRQKVIAYLLGKKVAYLLGKSDSETAAAKEIPLETGLPKGTVGPKLKELSEARLVSQTDSSEYYVGPHQVGLALDDLKKGISNEPSS